MSAVQKANELARAIMESGEYRELMQSKQLIERNTDHLNKIKDLRSKQYDIHVSVSSNKQPDKSKIDNINRLFGELNKIPEMKRYFDAEKNFNEFVNQVIKIIGDKIDSSLK